MAIRFNTPVGEVTAVLSEDGLGIVITLQSESQAPRQIAEIMYSEKAGRLQGFMYSPNSETPFAGLVFANASPDLLPLVFTDPWDREGYEDWPLVCVKIPGLTKEQVYDLLALFDSCYAETGKDTREYAVEYQILARNLTDDGSLLVNPREMVLDEETMDQLREILTPAQMRVYEKAMAQKPDAECQDFPDF